MKDGKKHNVLFACSMANSIYAFDADTGHIIAPYPISLGPAIPNSNTLVMEDMAFWGINDQWGILSTPVIDGDTKTMYVVNWTTEPDGLRVFHMNGIDLATGLPRHPPQAIQADYGLGAHYTAFDHNMQKQRAALLLCPLPQTDGTPAKKVIYMACGEIQEGMAAHHGWVVAFDPDTLKSTASWCVTPTGQGGGIWMAGQGPSCDAHGDLYVMTSNGDFNDTPGPNGALYNPKSNYSECFVKLHYSPPTPKGNDGTLVVIDWWCPFRDADRRVVDGYDFHDQDLGSSGAVLPAGTDLLLGAGKDGILYIFNRNHLGRAFQDYSFLKQNPPAFITYDPPPGASSTGNLDFFAADNKTHHLHGTPVVWKSPGEGWLLFDWGENDYLRGWNLDAVAGRVSLRGKGAEIATADGPHGGMPGGMLSLSANGDIPHTGILWATTPIHEDSSRYVGAGILRAYDATQLDSTKNADGTMRLKLLWDSAKAGPANGTLETPAFPFNYDKFCPPVVADGRVIVATYDGHIDIYTLK
jgi:outer membrane protein assembly factor BamB